MSLYSHYSTYMILCTNLVVFLHLFLTRNFLYSPGKIKSDGLFGRLPNLVKLDLRRNQVTGIEENAFEGASKLSEL